MNKEEIQTQRKSWELEYHWQLRSTFMNIHCDAFPKDKLLCLAQAFVNVETLGVQYSQDLMEEIQKLTENFPNLSKYQTIKAEGDMEDAERKQEKKNSLKCSKYARNHQQAYKLNELFPVGSKCFILNEQYYGDLADIIEVQKKTNKVKVMIQRVAEPDLIEVKNRSYELMSKEYMTNHALAQRLSVNPCIVSRLTGTVMVEKANGNKVNIGLNLKFNTRREYVPGYSQRRDETWLFSWKTLKLMEEYNSKFPELFINLSRLADQKRFQPEQIFNGPNPEAKISEVAAWLKTLPYQNARRMKFDTEALDEVVVKCIEDVLDAHKVFANQYEPITLVYSTNQLYRPANIIGHSPPDPNATFNLFDRVVNVREGISVPLGARGVIIGKTKDKQDDDTYLCDIVFDKSFIGGMSYNCSAGRGYRLHPYNLINISYRKKKGSYGVREDFDMAPIQPTKIDQRDKKARQKASPGFKKLINLSPNRNHERHDYSNRREYNDQGNQSYTHHNYSDHRNNKQVISSPIQINHSPKSLFQSPRESNNSAFTSLWNKIRNQEGSPPEESASHMVTASSVSPSLPKSNMTGNDLVEMCKNMELKQTENRKSARAKLDEWCLAKFGSKPVYDISRVGPGHIILPFVKVILPNKDEFGFPSNSYESSDKMFEACAALALRSLKIDDSSIDLSLIAPPVLPPPPLKWFEQDKSRPIPESFVAENHQLLNRAKEEQKTKQSTSRSPLNQQYQHPYQNPHQNSYQQQQPHQQQPHQQQPHQQQQPQQQQHQQPHFTHHQNNHYQAQTHHNRNTRNGQHRGNQQFEGPIMTNRPVAMSRPFSMQPFSSKPHPQRPETSYGEQQQQQQIYRPFPRQMTGPRPNKFIPLQVERNKQSPRESQLSYNAKRIQDAKRALAQENRAEHIKNEMIDHSPRLSEHTESGRKSISRRRSRVMVGIGSKPEPAE